MEGRIREAFDAVRADEALLRTTAQRLRQERERRQARREKRFSYRRLTAVAAMALLLLVGVAAYQWYRVPAAFVSIDINPSIELSLNRMNRVVGSYAFNREGEQILGAVNLNSKSCEEAVGLLLRAVEEEGYLPDGSLVSLSVQTASEREAALGDVLAATVERQLVASRITAEIEVFPVAQEIREEAHGCQMSPAKYLAIQELLEVDAQATLEEYSHHSIQQIRSRTQECVQGHASEAGGEPGSAQGEGHGHGSGHGGGRGQGRGDGRS